jgi:5-methylcytosine-specific restriction endonuclease McrA
MCLAKGTFTKATCTDHIKPINQGGARYDRDNLQPLCDACHNHKSGKEAHISNDDEQ